MESVLFMICFTTNQKTHGNSKQGVFLAVSLGEATFTPEDDTGLSHSLVWPPSPEVWSTKPIQEQPTTKQKHLPYTDA